MKMLHSQNSKTLSETRPRSFLLPIRILLKKKSSSKKIPNAIARRWPPSPPPAHPPSQFAPPEPARGASSRDRDRAPRSRQEPRPRTRGRSLCPRLPSVRSVSPAETTGTLNPRPPPSHFLLVGTEHPNPSNLYSYPI
jgi:hypothetical protein